jgi:hypothetical protein
MLVIASEAKQSSAAFGPDWIAASLSLLAMTAQIKRSELQIGNAICASRGPA